MLPLVATLHDPDGAQLRLAAPLWPLLHELYAEILLECSPETPPEVVAGLRAAGALTFQEAGVPNSLAAMGAVRLRAMGRAVVRGYKHLHGCDWDRALHWAATFPAELRTIVQAIPAYDLLILGRTRRALATHPEAQRETERLANAAFATITGEPRDITSGSRGASAAAVAALQRWSRCAGLGVDGEWPVLLRRLGFSLGYFAAEGLEYETADRHAAAIEGAGGLEFWFASAVNTPAEWVRRLGFAHEIAAAALDAATRPLGE